MRRSVALAIAFALALSLAESDARAHDLGISRMNLVEQPDGKIHARFTFTAREASAAFDRDGHVAVDVRTDGESCVPGPATTTPDGDGLLVDEDFACAKATRSIEAIAYFVTQMGPSHEDVAIVETPEGTHEELLRASHRAIVVALSRAPRRESPRRGKIAALAAAGAVALALVIVAIRYILQRRA